MSTLTPVFWLRMFGIARWRVELSSKGIHVDNHMWPWDEELHCKIVKRWFSRSVEISGRKAIKINGVSRRDSEILISLIRLARNISAAHTMIEQLLASKFYVAEFDRDFLVQKLQSTCPTTDDHAAQWLGYVPDLKQKYNRVLKYIKGERAEIDRRNEDFISLEIARWDEWLRKIETSPLTTEQARSAVIMEDRNLLVAAAGSGKTSTLVAKAGYAIAKGYCRADEVLVLTFNRKIKEELTERIQKRFSNAGLNADVTVDTFNSFGLRQVRKLKKTSRLAPWADSQAKEFAHLKSLANGLVKRNPQFAYSLAEFSAVWLESDEKEESEIVTATGSGTFDEAMRLLLSRAAPRGSVPTYVTLRGETVRSLQELRICNWLTLMGVDYEYERSFDVKHVPLDWQSGYRPDFYYPSISCWHEHFGLNKLGKAPPWMSRQGKQRERTYEEEVAEKRKLLIQSSEKWFETTSADFDSRNWESKILRELRQQGLSPEFIGWDKFSADFKSFEFITKDVISVISSCLRHAKSNRLTVADVEKRLGATKSQRSRSFLSIFVPIYEAYEVNLHERDELDFEDMVIRASDGFKNRTLAHSYRLILVDEFQDVSNSRAELVSAMLSQSSEARLFGVGDDWQSIYRFAGADITAMTKFEERFGFTSKNWLTQTFRSNQFIADVASRFIMRNPAQLKKTVKALSLGNSQSVEVVFYTGEVEDFIEENLELISDSFKLETKMPEILILGRYNFLKPERLDQWQETYKDKLLVSFLTIHRSKGLEADIVILMGATSRKGQNFPSTIQDDPILSYFMPDADELLWAEERRLFYVALTRARDRIIILTPEGYASQFVQEIVQSNPISRSLYSGGQKIEIVDPKPHLKLPQCPRCEKGFIMKRVSTYGPFEFCNLKCGYKRNLPSELQE